MTTKKLAAFITKDLILDLGEHTYRVKPPSRDTGKLLTAINVVGVSTMQAALGGTCPTCGRPSEAEIDPEIQALADTAENKELGELSLGKDVLDQMIADGLDGATIDTMSLYAMYFWLMGEAVADAILEQKAEGADGEGPKVPTDSKNGPATE